MTEFLNPSEEMDPIASKLREGERSVTQFERARCSDRRTFPVSEEMDVTAKSMRLQSEQGMSVEDAQRAALAL